MIFQYEGETYDVTKMHTKQLLNLLRNINTGPYCECCHDPEWLEQKWAFMKKVIPVIQAELSTREHVPNKKEAKMIRKQKAVEQKNKKNKKYRNR